MTRPNRCKADALGDTALRILAVVEACQGSTLRSLARAVGVLPFAVQCHLRRLERFGLVHVERGKTRRARTAVATCRFIPADDLWAFDLDGFSDPD